MIAGDKFRVPLSDLVLLFKSIDEDGCNEMAIYMNNILTTIPDLTEDFGYSLIQEIIENSYHISTDELKSKLSDTKFKVLNINKL